MNYKQWFNADKTVQYLECTKENKLYKRKFDVANGNHGEWVQIVVKQI